MIQISVLALTCILFPSSDGDRVAKKLAVAKAAYQGELKKFKTAVDEWLERQESAARREGDRKLLDRLKADRAAFASKETLPIGAPAPFQKRQAKFRGAMEGAYAAAVKEYTKAGMDEAAAGVEAELAKLRLVGKGLGYAVGGTVTLVVRNGGRVLGTSANSAAEGAPVIIWDDVGQKGQRWRLVPDREGFVVIRNVISDRVLTISSDKFRVAVHADANGEPAAGRQWKPIPVAGETDTFLLQHCKSGRYLSIHMGSTENGGQAAIWPLNGDGGTADQHWKVERRNDS